MSDISPSGSIDVCSSLRVDFSLIREKCGEYTIDVPSNATDAFKMALRSLNTLRKQLLYLSSADGIRSDGQNVRNSCTFAQLSVS